MKTFFYSITFFALVLTGCSSSSDTDYSKQLNTNVSHLSNENKAKRDSTYLVLTKSPVYISLVDQKVVKEDYLVVLTALGQLMSSVNGDDLSMSSTTAGIIEQNNEYHSFIRSSIGLIGRGGLPMEFVEVFNRYKDAYGYYGLTSKEEANKTGYNLAPALMILDEDKKTVDAFYEASIDNINEWALKWKDPSDSNHYSYPYLMYTENFRGHLDSIAPDSRYNFSKYKTIGDPIKAGYHEVTANNVRTSTKVNTGNPYSSKKADEGNTFLLLNVTYKNIDSEGRTLLSPGSVYIMQKDRELELDKTELIMADGYGVFIEALNPMSKKTTTLVYPMASEIKGDLFWKPTGGERIYLGNLY